jgi:hypothetical protein
MAHPCADSAFFSPEANFNRIHGTYEQNLHAHRKQKLLDYIVKVWDGNQCKENPIDLTSESDDGDNVIDLTVDDEDTRHQSAPCQR